MVPQPLPRPWLPPTYAEVEAIVRMQDAALRNLHITQAYHVLKLAFTAVLGDVDVSWCGFATWASKTAGTFIRKDMVSALERNLLARAEDLMRTLGVTQARLLVSWGLPSAVSAVLSRVMEPVVDGMAKQVAIGNLIVFEDLGPLYVAMLEHFTGPGGMGPAALARVVSRLKPGPLETGGQDLLIQAARAYQDALRVARPKDRAERVFLANALVGYHEQTRLQGPIVGALGAPLKALFLVNLLELFRTRASGLPEPWLLAAFTPLAEQLERCWRELMTRELMTLELPDRTLRLGEDIPALTPSADFPRDLLRLEHPELLRLMKRLDRTPDDTAGSAARDWGALSDRMNLVVDLFRSRQQDRGLYQAPFTPSQVEAFQHGRMPHGRL
ncbi:hypothetical protein [Corallococcus sp. Z5C101001]|uniref:hypothetical protein n=1 Tax=Corallococcus sp. Z5C101001 TaxID=2596829 RepID=UPI00117FDBCB|nr:hypothetical protein [Corallococcus sp. Z5C101001]TSC32668.1 hypothetical protein FOF48_06585 [Corallococcus sp. Z5C101001]